MNKYIAKIVLKASSAKRITSRVGNGKFGLIFKLGVYTDETTVRVAFNILTVEVKFDNLGY